MFETHCKHTTIA